MKPEPSTPAPPTEQPIPLAPANDTPPASDRKPHQFGKFDIPLNARVTRWDINPSR